ncbi:MAG: MtnX-like HAD-IB family phosphatase [Tissierella sp.]|nr:MtnX-like HAD-IB family phosphatase [Tissierella sp.]
MTDINIKDICFLIDFDGTITKMDSNDLLVEKFSHNPIKDISQTEGEVNFMESFSFLINNVNITEEEYLEFMLKEVELTKGFYDFYKKSKSLNIPMAVISGGFENGILPFLNKHDIKDIDVYANRLNFGDNNISIEYYHNIDDCCDIGSCGNCKVIHYERYKKDNKKVIFIGDGITDRSVAGKADIVFAKDGLLKYCNKNDIDCIPWKDFDDISKIIFGTI